jgi:hypothetical protein
MPGSSTPGKLPQTSLLRLRGVVFRVVKLVDLPVLLNFEAHSLSGLHPDCLRLNDTVTIIAPRLAIGGVASPFQAGVPPAKLLNLCSVALTA